MSNQYFNVVPLEATKCVSVSVCKSVHVWFQSPKLWINDKVRLCVSCCHSCSEVIIDQKEILQIPLIDNRGMRGEENTGEQIRSD